MRDERVTLRNLRESTQKHQSVMFSEECFAKWLKWTNLEMNLKWRLLANRHWVTRGQNYHSRVVHFLRFMKSLISNSAGCQNSWPRNPGLRTGPNISRPWTGPDHYEPRSGRPWLDSRQTLNPIFARHRLRIKSTQMKILTNFLKSYSNWIWKKIHGGRGNKTFCLWERFHSKNTLDLISQCKVFHSNVSQPKPNVTF